MIDTALLVLIVTIAAATLVSFVFVRGGRRDVQARARTGVRLHQIRRTRELTELRLAIRRDAQQLRRALDRDFEAADEE